MKLYDVLLTKDGGQALAERLRRDIREVALLKLEHIRGLFPHFTDHTIRHSEGVIQILDWLLPDHIKVLLNEWELYFLIAAAYLHDIGMVEGCPGSPSGDEWEKYAGERTKGGTADESAELIGAKRDYIRGKHHKRSELYIRSNFLELGLRASQTRGEGEIVGRISLGHRQVHLGDRRLFSEVAFGNNQIIHRDLLAAYLRLADELDTTAFRTPLAEYEILGNLDEKSSLEWAKHLSIFGVRNQQGTIVLSGECRDHAVFLRLIKLEADLKSKLREIRESLPRPYVSGEDFFIPDPVPYFDVKMDITHLNYLPINIKFELQDGEITKLIMGERLYGDKTACIRELLQNSIDTCREATERRPANWRPEIIISEKDHGKVISITDNGMGMDQYIVQNYFSRVGISYYSSKDFTGQFRPISEFGIGILSCFMLCEHLHVDTKMDGKEAIEFDIFSVTEPFVPRSSQRPTSGTSIYLHLREDEIGKYSLLERVRHFTRYVTVPVRVITKDGKIYENSRSYLAPDVEEVIGRLRSEYRYLEYSKDRLHKAIHANQATIEREGIRFGLTLIGRVVSLHAFKSQSNSRNENVVRIYQEGIFVAEASSIIDVLAKNTWCDIDFSGQNRLRLTADRTRLIDTSVRLISLTKELYGEAIECLYDQTISKKNSATWWRFHLEYYQDVHPESPTALKNSHSAEAYYCTLNSKGFMTLSVRDIIVFTGRKYWISVKDHGYLTRMRDVIADDMLIGVMPIERIYPDNLPWFYRELGGFRGGVRRLLTDTGIKITTYTIAGKRRDFIDAKAELRQWRIAWGWLDAERHERTTLFDMNDNFSKFLVRYCQGDLPQKSRLLIDELFRKAYTFSPAKLVEAQQEVVKTLRREFHGEVERVTVTATQPVEPHDCPYHS